MPQGETVVSLEARRIFDGEVNIVGLSAQVNMRRPVDGARKAVTRSKLACGASSPFGS